MSCSAPAPSPFLVRVVAAALAAAPVLTLAAAGCGSSDTGSGQGKLRAHAVESGSGSGGAGSGSGGAGSGSGGAGSGSGGAGSGSGGAGSGSGGAGLPADLAAIKLTLEDKGWQRDADSPGSFQLVVTGAGGGDDSVVFLFRYGIEAAGAPAEREAYKAWLAEQRLLTVEQDRQRGGTWYLQGKDGAGEPSFRYVARFGAQRLVCGGSLYRDAESSKLGEVRDAVIVQAKKICESMTL